MINESLICRDIKAVLNSTKCFYGSYAELHKYDYKGSQTKMDEFISIAKLRFGEDAEKFLLRDKVIFPNVDGGYDFNFGNAAFTGGIAYSNNKWHTVFYYDTKSWDDCYSIYHELAHVIQNNCRIFDTKTVNNIFQNCHFSRNFTDISCKRKYKKQYAHHLKETHAEVFAAACMLLRSKNFMERADSSRRIKARIGKTFLNGMNDDRTIYPSRKFYMDFDARLRIIKEINNWYISGEIDDLIDKSGNINFENLADKTKEIVLKYTYSPEKFHAVLNDTYTDCGKLFKAKLFAAFDPDWINSAEINEIRNQLNKHKRINDNLWQQKLDLLPEGDEEASILNTVCRLDRAYAKLLNYSREYSADVSEYKNFNLEFCVDYGRVPDSLSVMYIDSFFQDDDKSEGENIFSNYRRDVNNALFDNHADKEIVAKLVVAMRKEPSVRTEIWNMYRERQKNPNAQVRPQNFVAKTPIISHKKQQQLELMTFNYVKKMIFEKVDNLSEQEVQIIRGRIIELAATNPDMLENIEVKDLYKPFDDETTKEKMKSYARQAASYVHIAYYIDKETFGNVMKKYQSALQKFNGKKNDITTFGSPKTKNNIKCC